MLEELAEGLGGPGIARKFARVYAGLWGQRQGDRFMRYIEREDVDRALGSLTDGRVSPVFRPPGATGPAQFRTTGRGRNPGLRQFLSSIVSSCNPAYGRLADETIPCCRAVSRRLPGHGVGWCAPWGMRAVRTATAGVSPIRTPEVPAVPQSRLRSSSRVGERGAVAVEFAIVVPVLIMILLGIIEFGLAFNSQLEVTNAAREGARSMVIRNSVSAADAAAEAATPGLSPALTSSEIAFSFTAADGSTTTQCGPGITASATISYPYAFLTGWFGTGYTQTGKAAMKCGG